MKKSIAVIAVIICVLITGCATKTNGAVSYSTVIGRIKDEGITEIRQEVEFLAANSIYCDDSPLFYQRREDCFYVFDEKEDQLSTIRLKKRENNAVLMAMTAGKKVAVIIWQEGGVLREVVNERENLSEVIL